MVKSLSLVGTPLIGVLLYNRLWFPLLPRGEPGRAATGPNRAATGMHRAPGDGEPRGDDCRDVRHRRLQGVIDL